MASGFSCRVHAEGSEFQSFAISAGSPSSLSLSSVAVFKQQSGEAAILVPRGRAPFGQHQESRPLAESNNGSPQFTDFPSLCACSVSSLTNLIGSGINLLCLQIHSKPNVVGPGQRSRFLVLTKRSAASGDENGSKASGVAHILKRIFSEVPFKNRVFYFRPVGVQMKK